MARRIHLGRMLVLSLPLFAVASAGTADDAIHLMLGSSGYVPTDITCLIEPSMVVDLGSPVKGVIEAVTVERSDTVKSGQVIARLHSAVEEADIAYQSAKAAYGRRKAKRSEDLRRKQLISEQDLDDLVTEQKLAELEVRQKQELLRLTVIRSTVDGVVVDRYKNPGDLVSQEKIVRIARIDPLYAEVVLPASMFGQIEKDDEYPVALPLSNATQMGRVAAVDKVIDPSSGTFRVRLAVSNPAYRYPSGQRCRVNFDRDKTVGQ